MFFQLNFDTSIAKLCRSSDLCQFVQNIGLFPFEKEMHYESTVGHFVLALITVSVLSSRGGNGSKLCSVYFLSLETEEHTSTRKLQSQKAPVSIQQHLGTQFY